MALGNQSTNTYNNNKDDNKYTPTVYSGYGFSNTESSVDPTKLTAAFWNGMLKLTITPLKGPVVEGKQPEWDKDKAISIHLTHTKARMFYDEICAFQANPGQLNDAGVPSGAGLISLSNGKEFGTIGLFLIIRKIDGNTGIATASYAYEMKPQYHYAIRNYDQETADYDKVFYDNLEVEQFKVLLQSYADSMTNAVAYSVIEALNYNNTTVQTKLNDICQNLGIEYNKKAGNSRSSTSAFNTREPRNSFSAYSLEDIENQMG